MCRSHLAVRIGELVVQLPLSLRESLMNNLEELLGKLSDAPDPEMVASQIIEHLELYADEEGLDDIVVSLEESGALGEPLQEMLEAEMRDNSDFEFTEEECVSLLEEMCEIEWEEDDDDLPDDDTDESF